MKWLSFALVAATALPASGFVVLPKRAIHDNRSPRVMVAMDESDTTTENIESSVEDAVSASNSASLEEQEPMANVNGASSMKEELLDSEVEEEEEIVEDLEDVLTEEDMFDIEQMRHAIQMAQSAYVV